MRISAISYVQNQYSALNKVIGRRHDSPQKPTSEELPSDTVSFRGTGGRLLGGAVGSVGGAAAGGAIIGGGTLAGLPALIALGPVGVALAGVYTVGGALLGGYLGSEAGDLATGDD